MAEAQMLTVPEVAQLLRVSDQTVRAWLRRGTLRGIRPGGTKVGWRIPRDVVDALLRAEPTQLELPVKETKRGTKKLAA